MHGESGLTWWCEQEGASASHRKNKALSKLRRGDRGGLQDGGDA
jgi:hypothetical protein